MNVYHFHVDPIPAPTMTAADRYKNRPIVTRYFAYRDLIRFKARLQGLDKLPGSIHRITFRMPMPKSWSKKKKAEMYRKPHTSRPDIDNILRGIMNVFGEDSHIFSINHMEKHWDYEGTITLEIEKSATVETPVFFK